MFDPSSLSARLHARVRTVTRTGTLRWALLWFPVLLIAVLGWTRRWSCDDAFINFRIVRQFQSGNGPVFNAGDRIEAGTSPLWILVLAVADWILPVTLEWLAVLLSLVATALGVGLAIAGARSLWGADSACLMPLGALIFVSIPVVWDFTTSGLETGLGMLWIGLTWWMLVRWATCAHDRTPKPRSLCLLLGVGPFVRPDFAVFAVCFACVILWLLRARRRAALWTVLWLALLPVMGTLIRMAYFGLPVPNTAIAKEAAGSNWRQGFLYLNNLVEPYALWAPLIVVVALMALALFRRVDAALSGRRRLALAAVSGAGLHGLYIVRLGGDFMHGRMLLPTLLVLLLPAAAVPVSRERAVGFTLVSVWAVLCIFSFRSPQSAVTRGSTPATPESAVARVTGIADERTFYRRFTGVDHPVTIHDHSRNLRGQVARQINARIDEGQSLLFVDSTDSSRVDLETFPLSPDAASRHRSIVVVGSLGVVGYVVHQDIWVFDRLGLADSLAAHQELTERGRPGHEKKLPLAWTLAAWADPAVVPQAGVSADDLAAARRALQCGHLPKLFEVQRSKLGIGQMIENLAESFSLWRFRMPKSPVDAAADLCN